jgi:hypothetical protein
MLEMVAVKPSAQPSQRIATCWPGCTAERCRFRHVEQDFSRAVRQERDDGLAGRHNFADLVEDLLDAAGRGGGLCPPRQLRFGGGHGGGEGRDLLLGGGDLVGPGGKVGDGAIFPRCLNAGGGRIEIGFRLVEGCDRDDGAGREVAIALIGLLRHRQRRLGIGELRVEHADFFRALAGLEIGEARSGLGELRLGFGERRTLIAIVEGEERGTGFDGSPRLTERVVSRPVASAPTST